MKNARPLFTFLALFVACRTTPPTAWDKFCQCATNACVAEAVAVKDELVKNPAATLVQFQKTYEKGEDHVVGWLHIMRDSVLFNSAKFGATEARFAMQQQIVGAVKPLENDPKLEGMAKTILDVIEQLAIASELEDAIFQPVALTGTYAYELPDEGGSGELLVSQIAGDKIRFKLTIVGGKPAHNQGYMEGEATISMPHLAEFTTKEFGGECQLKIMWGDSVEIETVQGDDATCGFGHNVRADGKYKRVSFDNPFLTKNEAKTAQNLLGEWQSTADPKAMLKIADGFYIDIYEGETWDEYLFNYFPTCPKDCSPAGKTSCLKIFGQDEVCHAVVKADGKTLQLSQIGGTGNTLTYTRKK